MPQAPAILVLCVLASLLPAGCIDAAPAGPSPSAAPSSPSSPSSLPPSDDPAANGTARFLAAAPNATLTHASAALLEPGPDTFWFVDVAGNEVAEWPDYMCDRGFSFVVHPDQREVEVDPAFYPYEPGKVARLVALSVDDTAGCPLAHHLQVNQQLLPLFPGDREIRVLIDETTGWASVEQGLDRYGLAPGDQLVLTTTVDPGTGLPPMTVQVSILNHGAWPKAGLHADEDGLYW